MNANARNDDGVTPLLALVGSLTEKRRRSKTKQNKGIKFFHHHRHIGANAVITTFPHIITYTRHCHIISSPFLTAFAKAFSKIRLLMQYGAKLDAVDNRGYSAAHMTQEPKVLRFLLETGLSPNIVASSDGMTPMHCAANRKNPALLRVLVEFGGDVNARAHDGSTPLHYVNNIESAVVLLSHGVG